MAFVCDAGHMLGGQEHIKHRRQRMQKVHRLSLAPGVLVKNARAWAASQAWGTGPWGAAREPTLIQAPHLNAQPLLEVVGGPTGGEGLGRGVSGCPSF